MADPVQRQGRMHVLDQDTSHSRYTLPPFLAARLDRLMPLAAGETFAAVGRELRIIIAGPQIPHRKGRGFGHVMIVEWLVEVARAGRCAEDLGDPRRSR